ncbi:methyltransferase, FxLD system [Streptomyces sp. VNUA24]|uniref:methyltransferase, FxLD system n=1 Tax=Streptomyces sp. VNUA24 TaxID=3031131 RepID=UPI0023B7CDC2|nr:methyltransferase, FxLD system [Streptomyces sp. VNUA24]WEH16333.1 methyltransferase, FxLD system [Streptomyces sp. VNUA24]
MNTDTGASPEDLRNRLVDAILKQDPSGLRDARVETAMRTVPRHGFLPDAPLQEAYANKSVTIKENPDEDALPLSCASQPDVVHFMLVQLAVREGDNVFEIGAGSGYNAALLKHLAGPSGHVTTCDIDPDVTAYTRRMLDTNGYGDVRVVTRDGALGAEEFGPYDRMIAAVGMWDLPGTWWDQLAVGGRLVVPLRWRGLSRSVAFRREKDRMTSDSVKMCGFLPVIGQDGERNDYIDDDRFVRLYWDEDQPIVPELLRDALTRPKTVVWTDATVGPVESFDGVWLRLSATERATCRITANPAAMEAGLHRPASPALSPALVEGDSIAYFTLERTAEDPGTEPRFRLGAVGYGPAGADLAERICAQIRAWSPARTVEPAVTAYPADTPDSDLADGAVIDRPSVRLVITY